MRKYTLLKRAYFGFLFFGVLIIIWMGLCVLQREKNIVQYSIDQRTIAFHTDWPTYGLPIAELILLLNRLDSGEMDKMRWDINFFLDTAIYDAMMRWEASDATAHAVLEKPLLRAAAYRDKHLRPQWEYPDIVMKRNVAVDMFLGKFNRDETD